jgi:NAD(P)-dependent dehydrogenase (short-subunit alcohol dehydrogenase family)
MTQIGGLFDLSGRVAIVTGATGVLGGAMARGLAAAGARVGVLGRREEPAKNVAVEIVDSGAEALALLADVLEREQLEDVREAILERWGRVDILVNAAGVTCRKPRLQTTPKCSVFLRTPCNGS